MKNFIKLSVILTAITILAVYSLKLLGFGIFSPFGSAFFGLLCVMFIVLPARPETAQKCTASVSTLTAAVIFSFSFMNLNGLVLALITVPIVLTISVLVDIRTEVPPEKRKEYFQQMLALMLAQFVILSYAIIYLAK